MKGRKRNGHIHPLVRVWDFHTGQSAMNPLIGHNHFVTLVAFSPDGRYIVSGSHDKTIRLWDALTGHSLGDPFEGHYSGILSVVFSPDGRHIASGSSDKTVGLWDAHGGCIDLDPSAPSVALPAKFLQFGVRSNVSDTDTHQSVSHISKSKYVIFCPSKGDDNWIIGEDSKSYLFWVPPSNVHGLFFPRTVNVLGSTPTILDFSNFVHGTYWTQRFSLAL